ncbi:MAG TPA: hypothetical protein VMT85_16680 [Thermoanaerobaculia bacterium]|nr:hypothetical protein [Thermoanaerobaculia bacterium]
MAERKGLHPLAWVAIGCVFLVVVGTVAAAIAFIGIGRFAKNKVEDFAEQVENRPVETAAKALALVSREIQFVEADEDSRTATFRNVDTGEEVTVDLADIERGRVVFSQDGEETTFSVDSDRGGVRMSGPEGESVIGGGEAKPPAWVPLPPGVTTASAFSQSSGGRSSGTFAVEGSTSAALIEFYREALTDAGFELSESSFSGGGQSAQTLQGEDSEGRTVSVTVTQDGAQGRGVITYDGPTS